MRRWILAAAIAILLASIAAPAAAHPLGNYTVNRAVSLTIGADRFDIVYVVDMAEIPAFTEIASIDGDGNGAVSKAESQAYAEVQCGQIVAQLQVAFDGRPLTLSTGNASDLSFPAGAGGLQTLRLACHLTVTAPAAYGSVSIRDPIDDGHAGWREITIAAGTGVRLSASDVSDRSASSLLTSYPTGRLESPPDIRSASATFQVDAAATGENTAAPAVELAPTAGEPLAALIAGDLSPAIVLLALLAAAGLGAAHALSPGHGKALVAAYLIGSRGSIGQALGMGLTVALTHTVGVLLLGGLVLVAGELFLPELVIGWLTLASGGLMAVLGGALLWRAMVARTSPPHHHQHDHDHPHAHPDRHPGVGGHSQAGPPTLTVRSVALLGIAGGLVPSASALIVLLAAVTTGRLVFGLGLIVAFGLGMAIVLGGLAVATIFAHRWLGSRIVSRGPTAAAAVRLLPIGSGLVVLAIGLGIAWSAFGRLG